jgi:hypothetical protein
MTEKIFINCPVHGKYEQAPISATNTGCPKCWNTGGEDIRFDNQDRLLNGQTVQIQPLRGKHG